MRRSKRAYRGAEKQWCRRTLIRRDGCVCGLCGEPIALMRDVTLDHKHPRSKGGSDAIENLQLAHRACNQAKSDLTPEQWQALQGL